MSTIPIAPSIVDINENNNIVHSTQGKDEERNKVNSDGLSLPLMSDKGSNKHLSRSLSYEKFLSEANERVILNIGGKRFETYP
jgi:hypothetical protein